MSAISQYITQIQNAVYGEQVRSAIINALQACYSDVENPNLQSAAFLTAINTAYASGILDIVEVTKVNQMTNENIIYRYMGTEAGYTADTLYYYNGTMWVPIGSGVRNASTASQMNDTGAIYKYTGSESGYITNALYYYNGTAWVLISPPTDSTLQEEGKPADAYATGLAIARLSQNVGYLNNDAKTALITLLRNVAFIDQNGETYINNLVAALTRGGASTVIKTITPETTGYIKYGGFMTAPPYKSSVNYRSTYELFDIPCVYGYEYTFNFTSDVPTSSFVVMVFNENAVSAANSQQAISNSDYFDSGWISNTEEYEYTPPLLINNSPPAVVRFVAKMDNNDSTVTNDLWKSLVVTRSAL